MFRGLLLALALIPVAVGAALPPCASDQFMRQATDVVQIEVTGVQIPAEVGAANSYVNCPVQGVVRRVFRGTMKDGQSVSFGVLCWTDAVGPGWITNPDALKAARFLEVHMINDQPVDKGPSVLILDAFSESIIWRPECG